MGRPEALLLFAYHFPPENAIGGLRPYRFCKYLSRLGVRTHTVTAADVKTRPDLAAETVPDPFVAHPRQGAGWQVERAIRKFLLPGASGSQWSRAAYRAACRYLDANPSDPKKTFVFSTYPPLGTPLAGYWLAKRRRLPWILDFRDPMGDNPGDKHLNAFQKSIYRYLERKFVAAADCVTANTDAAQARLQKAYPDMARKIHLLWNGFDPEQRLMPLAVPGRSQKIYSHVGELYEGRVITPLLYSMHRLIQSGRISPAQILIQLVGPVRGTSIPGPEFMAGGKARGWLRVCSENLPQAEAQRIMQESDGLLLVQPHSTLQVPGKLFEYLQIGRPTLAFIPPETPIERILRKSGVPCAFAYSTASDEVLDEAVFAFFNLDTTAVQPNDWFEESFNVQRHAGQLFQLMSDLANPF
jgi:hypothetical protein